jgi:protocatechuate 3,4-dioxygenase beta subunit
VSPGDDRLTTVVGAVTDALAGVIREQRITEAEWYAALELIAEVGKADEMILLSDVLRLSVIVDRQEHEHEGSSPTNVLGPFWRPAPALADPASLVEPDEPGERMVLQGRITGAAGEPIAGAEVDIWQCGADGLYDVQRPDLDGATRHRGVVRTDGEGRYRVTTVVPPPYEVKKDGPVGRLLESMGRHAYRPAHIHLKVGTEGHRTLVTQAFIAGDPWFGDDATGADIAECVVELDRSGAVPTATFDVRLAPSER